MATAGEVAQPRPTVDVKHESDEEKKSQPEPEPQPLPADRTKAPTARKSTPRLTTQEYIENTANAVMHILKHTENVAWRDRVSRLRPGGSISVQRARPGAIACSMRGTRWFVLLSLDSPCPRCDRRRCRPCSHPVAVRLAARAGGALASHRRDTRARAPQGGGRPSNQVRREAWLQEGRAAGEGGGGRAGGAQAEA